MESKIKQLTGLKVDAVAVTLIESAHNISAYKNTLVYMDDSAGYMGAGYEIQLPEGSWAILGRADVIEPFIMEKLYGELVLSWGKCIAQWQSYCTANGLTNELILIKQS